MFKILFLNSFLFILIKSFEINSCNYKINKIDSTFDICVNNKCNNYIDPYSIMVIPNNCKTDLLYLSFSTYKTYSLFLNKTQWKLTDLYQSKQNNKIRLLRIFIYSIDNDDKPIDHNQLIRLGFNIDLYELFIKNITNQYYLNRFIHYDLNYPQWFIIKIKL